MSVPIFARTLLLLHAAPALKLMTALELKKIVKHVIISECKLDVFIMFVQAIPCMYVLNTKLIMFTMKSSRLGPLTI